MKLTINVREHESFVLEGTPVEIFILFCSMAKEDYKTSKRGKRK